MANDLIEKEKFFNVLKKTSDFIDIIEVGTPALLKNGISLVKLTKELFSKHKILADTKIIDAGFLEAKIAFEAGADIVTVLLSASTITIEQSFEAAKKYNSSIMIDTIGSEKIENLRKLETIKYTGSIFICLHTPSDISMTKTSDQVSKIKKEVQYVREILPDAVIAIAGGISLNTIDFFLLDVVPDIIVVGRSIYNSPDIFGTAKAIRKKMEVPK